MRVRGGSDGVKSVWLDRSEANFLLENADFGEQTGFVEAGGGQTVFVDDADDVRRFTLALALRCGLRVEEITSVAVDDVVETTAGTFLEVEHEDDRRRAPIPEWMASSIDGYSTSAVPGDSPLIDVGIDTVENWIREAGERCRIQSEEEGWRHIDSRDLRRTWARLLVDSGVDSALVMEWGGWSDWSDFRSDCYGSCPPEVERREATKPPWMESDSYSTGVSTRKVSERQQPDVDVRQ